MNAISLTISIFENLSIPTPDLLRVFDALVAEGRKIFFRFALAFFSSNKRAIKNLDISADELWSSAGNMKDGIIFEHAYRPKRSILTTAVNHSPGCKAGSVAESKVRLSIASAPHYFHYGPHTVRPACVDEFP